MDGSVDRGHLQQASRQADGESEGGEEEHGGGGDGREAGADRTVAADFIGDGALLEEVADAGAVESGKGDSDLKTRTKERVSSVTTFR
jgi:hypothetical protein